MSDARAPITDAVLYEGSLLYPYRASALKNRHPYPFGTLYPPEFCRAHDAGDAAALRLECVAMGGSDARSAQLGIHLRFLESAADAPHPRSVVVPPVSLDALAGNPATVPFAFGSLQGRITVAAVQARPGTWTLAVDVANDSAFAAAGTRSRDEALRVSLASPHLVLHLSGGAGFASAIDPPVPVRDLCARCHSTGTWPVLLGAPGSSDTLLAAPIILYDHPQIAPESTGDFFDATDIDELLTLRVLTLSDEEKAEIRAAGGAGAAVLERTEASVAHLRSLHGAIRPARAGVTPGMAVRLRPRGRADVMDLALAGRRATVESVAHDYEGRVYVAVTIDDDPGRDLGAFGHRFFFRPDEIEPA